MYKFFQKKSFIRSVHFNLYRVEAGKESLISQFTTMKEATEKLKDVQNFSIKSDEDPNDIEKQRFKIVEEFDFHNVKDLKENQPYFKDNQKD
jgi:hypothetical protein